VLGARVTSSIEQTDSLHRQHVVCDGERVVLYACTPDACGASLLHLTGSDAHVEALRRAALARGGTLTPSGLLLNGDLAFAEDEDVIYRQLGLEWIAPELREGLDEIDAARNGRSPRLVTRQDIRGDLHMHSRWSDGQDTIEEMVQASIALGYEYVAITDHSQSSAPVTNLKPRDIPRQADEIAGLRDAHPGISILHGCEVDILPNGTLDFSDRELERFDIVLASLHDEAGHAPERLLSRYRAAVRHALVSLITHPANRMVPHRAGYTLDYATLFAEAAETGTLVEIDGSPSHLDLSGEMAREAIGAGAMLAIDSDSHRVDVLGPQMALGVVLARRGWVEPRHVVNTRPLEHLRAFIAAKRR
jgi:DNA polymerase (family 10)